MSQVGVITRLDMGRQWIYPDEDDLDENGRRIEPFKVYVRGAEALGTDGMLHYISITSSPEFESEAINELQWRAAEKALEFSMRDKGVWPLEGDRQ